jgi:aspartyl protease family protein
MLKDEEMAHGDSVRYVRRVWPLAVILAICCALVRPGVAQDAPPPGRISLYAVFEGKAMLMVEGSRRMVPVGGATAEGVHLLSVAADRVEIEYQGRRQVLTLGAYVEPGLGEESGGYHPAKTVLWADGSGFFHADGLINGFPVKFLVDTGASNIAISTDLAKRIGIVTENTPKGLAGTAGGFTGVSRVTLRNVAVGDITLHNVEAGVLTGSFPQTPLLGMSFLGQLDMLREGSRLELKARR